MQVVSVDATDLFVGPPDAPLQLVRVGLSGCARATPVRVDGDGLAGEAVARAGQQSLEVPVAVRRPAVGERRSARVHARGAETSFEFVTAEPGWTMFMVSHFHR